MINSKQMYAKLPTAECLEILVPKTKRGLYTESIQDWSGTSDEIWNNIHVMQNNLCCSSQLWNWWTWPKSWVQSLCKGCQSLLARFVPSLRSFILLPPPFRCTVIFSYNSLAFVTLDCAAPVKFAVAAGENLCELLHRSEAAFIAQSAAAISLQLGRVLVLLKALSSLCTVQPQALVLDAVIWRTFQVNELRSSNAQKSVCDGISVVRAVPCSHRILVHFQFLCMFVFHLQVVAYLSEVGHLHPAGLDGATSRHSVTLAGFPHGCCDGLSGERKF